MTLAPSTGESVRRAAALSALGAATLGQVLLLISVPGPLALVILPAAAISAMAAAWRPWRWTLITVAVWPVFIDLGRSVKILAGETGWLSGAVNWANALPPYPLVLTIMASTGLVWAWRSLMAENRVGEKPEDALAHLSRIWLAVTAVGTLVGLASLNQILLPAVWRNIAEDLWRWPMLAGLDSFHPLAAGYAGAVGVLFFWCARAQMRSGPQGSSRPRALSRAVIASAALVSLVGLIQWFDVSRLLVENPTWVRDHRITGLLRDPNSCGTLLAGALLLACGEIVVLRREGSRGRVAAAVGAALLIGLATVLTGSRVAWIAAFALMAELVLRATRERSSGGDEPSRTHVIPLVCTAAIVVLILWPAAPRREGEPVGLFQQRVHDTVGWLSGDADEEMRAGLAGRQHHWMTALSMVRDHPWWGHGLGTARLRYDQHSGPTNPFARQNLHNQFLQTWAEMGLAGLLALLGILWVALGRGTGVLGARSALAAFVVTSLTGHPLVLPEMHLVLWVLVALCAAGRTSEPIQSPRWVWPAVFAAVLGTGTVAVARSFFDARDRPGNYGIYEVFVTDATGVPSVWTRRSAGLRIEVVGPYLMLPLRAGHPDVNANPVTATVSVEGEPLRSGPLTDDTWALWVLDLRTRIGQTVTLEISASRTWSPFGDLGIADPRSLGLALGPWEWLDVSLAPDPIDFEVWPTPDLLSP